MLYKCYCFLMSVTISAHSQYFFRTNSIYSTTRPKTKEYIISFKTFATVKSNSTTSSPNAFFPCPNFPLWLLAHYKGITESPTQKDPRRLELAEFHSPCKIAKCSVWSLVLSPATVSLWSFSSAIITLTKRYLTFWVTLRINLLNCRVQ